MCNDIDEKKLAIQLEAARQERVRKAIEEIQAILDKYNVSLQAVAVIPANSINIVPRGEPN